MSAVAIIPARGGSRRIQNKNRRLFHGKPIIQYSIETARESGLFDRIIVSTDDQGISQIAQDEGVQVSWRPQHLCEDQVGTQEVVAHLLQIIGVADGMACCLYATAPMLRPQTLVDAQALVAPMIGYVVPVATWLRDPGQFYFGWAHAFITGLPLLGGNTRLLPIDPATECDINTEADWTRAEAMYAALHPELVA